MQCRGGAGVRGNDSIDTAYTDEYMAVGAVRQTVNLQLDFDGKRIADAVDTLSSASHHPSMRHLDVQVCRHPVHTAFTMKPRAHTAFHFHATVVRPWPGGWRICQISQIIAWS
jgi:hypothetical protein